MTSSTVTDMSTLLMIDSASARDRDDAFAVTPLPVGHGWAVEVHIAGVADVVELGSVADEQAFLRAETRYLRGRTIPMLGETAEQAATLTSESRRTSLRVTGDITTDGRLVDVTVARGQIPSGRCAAIDHAEVPGILTDPTHPLHPPLAAADAAAQALLTARRDGGALAFYDLTRGWAANEDGAIVAIAAELRTVAYVIVQELMIATNEAVALWCIERGLPIMFRNHRSNPVAGSTDELMTEIAAAAGDPDLFAKLRGRLLSTLRAATYDPTVHGLSDWLLRVLDVRGVSSTAMSRTRVKCDVREMRSRPWRAMARGTACGRFATGVGKSPTGSLVRMGSSITTRCVCWLRMVLQASRLMPSVW
ncbi:RNB domain-containing ribonuclease [Streptomyces sp. NPDC058171]